MKSVDMCHEKLRLIKVSELLKELVQQNTGVICQKKPEITKFVQRLPH